MIVEESPSCKLTMPAVVSSLNFSWIDQMQSRWFTYLEWIGKIDQGAKELKTDPRETVDKLINYIQKHRHRIISYKELQESGGSIGSGGVASSIKQIGKGIKISGARWKQNNISRVLRQRCAYLNGSFSQGTSLK